MIKEQLEIDLVPLDELIEAVHRRFDSSVIAGIRLEDGEELIHEREWEGEYLTCQGLLMDMITHIGLTTEPEEEEVEDEQED